MGLKLDPNTFSVRVGRGRLRWSSPASGAGPNRDFGLGCRMGFDGAGVIGVYRLAGWGGLGVHHVRVGAGRGQEDAYR
jgi:hypothetical protein